MNLQHNTMMARSTTPAPGKRLRMPHLTFAERSESARDVTWHTHNSIELVLVTTGKCRCSVGGKTLPGEPGMLWIMPARTPQYQRNAGLVRTTFIGFRASPAYFNDRPRAIEVGADGYVRRWMEDLVDLHRHGASCDAIVDSLLATLLGKIGHIETHQARVAKLHPAIEQAMTHIESHLTEPLEIGRLARSVHLSTSHLTAMFRKSLGYPPLRYQQRLRLRQAERLLRSPYSSIKQVAAACGYNDPNYFVRLFRERYGRPPQRWRNS